jgi:hypothetical protein
MAKQRSILERFSDTMKGLTDSAALALKSEEPARVDETSAAYMPFVAEGLVSDPLLVAPAATQLGRRKRRAPKKTARRGAAKKSAPRKPVRKAARKSASARSRQVTKTTKNRGGTRKAARRRGRRSST